MIINGEGGRATPGWTVKVGTLEETTVHERFQGFEPGTWLWGSGSPLGAQSLTSQLDLESELWWGSGDWEGLGLRGLREVVMLLFVLLVFFVFALVDAVQAGGGLTCRVNQQPPLAEMQTSKL